MAAKNQENQSRTQLSPLEIRQLAEHVRHWKYDYQTYSPSDRSHVDEDGLRRVETYDGEIAGFSIRTEVDHAGQDNNLVDPKYSVSAKITDLVTEVGRYYDESQTVSGQDAENIRQTYDIAKHACIASELERRRKIEKRSDKMKERMVERAVARARKLISGGKK